MTAYGTNVQAAMNAAAGGTLIFPVGQTYTVAPLSLPANETVRGNGSTLLTVPNSTTPTTSDAILTIAGGGDTVTGLIFDGNVDNQGGVWSQWRHAVVIDGASNINLSGNTFRRLIGDGVYITGNASAVDVSGNAFQGAHKNRNGVSVIYASGVDVHDNSFDAMARPDMPGAVDLEPNSASQHLTDVAVYSNTVTHPTRTGILAWDTAGASISNVTIADNTVTGPMVISGGAGILANVPTAGLTISGNTVADVSDGQCIEIDYGAGLVLVTGNTLDSNSVGIWNWHGCMSQSGNTFINNGTDVIQTSPTC
jgi:hypothetical protein